MRFSWCPSGDLSSNLHEYEMCVHLFGVMSSAGVANIVLQKCATDYRKKFGGKAFFIILRNFYVDNLLKSSKCEEYATNLALNTNQMCAAGGFNL